MPAPDQRADIAGAFMDDYFAECDEHLHSVRTALLSLEAAVGNRPPPAAVEELFRSFHSLKGISAMVELHEAEQLAHEMESCLRAFGARDVIVSAQAVDSLIDGVHAFEEVTAARRVQASIPSIAEPMRRLVQLSTGLQAAVPAADTPVRAASDERSKQLWKVTFTPTPELVVRGIKVDTIRGRLSQHGRIQKVAPRVVSGGIAFDFVVAIDDGSVFSKWGDDGVRAEPMPDVATAETDAHDNDAATSDVPRVADHAVSSTNLVRVDLARLDELLRLVGDLVVSRARLDDALSKVEAFVPAAQWRDVQEHSDTIERRLRDLREGVMRVRMVPVGEIFRRMPFVVRDLARDSGKRLRLDVVGESTEIDKFLIERMMDPVLHLVRNAVSHGIESPDERTAIGKPPEGTIRLSAATVGESVLLEVSDDGRGLDADAIAQRARRAGMLVPDRPDSRVLLDIIAAPGFSTRDAADRVSGRGVGMAVVRETIHELGGTISLETIPGRGTTFRIALPVTLAIADAMIVHVGDRVFAVPQSSVREVGEVDPAGIRALENNELITHRGEALPVVRLGRVFAIQPTARARLHVLIIGRDAAPVGILVDRIAGQQEIVVKAIADPLVKVPGVSGATELGDGRLVLILDPPALARLARSKLAAGRAH